MNFLGKCFVVALFVMSCAFMGAAIAAYGAHRDLQAEKQKLQTQLQQTQQARSALEGKYTRINSELEAEASAARQRVVQLESEKIRLVERNADAQRELDQLRSQSGEAIAAMNATQQNNNALADELKGVRDSIRDALSDKDRYFAAALEATEKFQAIRNDIETALEHNRELVADTGRMASLLRANNLNPETPADAITPKVDGLVSRTQRKNGVQLVEISIGSDDGIRTGDTVDVFRNTHKVPRPVGDSPHGARPVGWPSRCPLPARTPFRRAIVSQLDSSSADLGPTRGGITKKPPMTVYTVLMMLATVALTIGCIFLYLEAVSYK